MSISFVGWSGRRSAGLLTFSLLIAISSAVQMHGASVRDFGATGNGVTDDTVAIQRALDGTTSGTLVFPPGTYRVTKTLRLSSNVVYDGGGKAILTGTNGDFLAKFPWAAVNSTATGLIFDGGGLTFDGGSVSGIRISGNTFQNITVVSNNWTIRNAIFAGTALRNSSIDHNSFKNILPNGSTRWDGTIKSIDDTNGGIFVYGLDATSIDHNTFDHVGQGMKVCFSQGFPTRDVYIGYNVMTHIHRMGMEIQSGVGCGGKTVVNGDNTFNLVVEFNSLTSWDDFYWNSTGISAADAAPLGANGVFVRYNLINGGVATYDGFYGYGIEAAGLGLEVNGNVIAGSYGQSIGIGSKSLNANIHDNYTCALKPGSSLVIGQEDGPSTGATYTNNRIAKTCPSLLPTPGVAIPIS